MAGKAAPRQPLFAARSRSNTTTAAPAHSEMSAMFIQRPPFRTKCEKGTNIQSFTQPKSSLSAELPSAPPIARPSPQEKSLSLSRRRRSAKAATTSAAAAPALKPVTAAPAPEKRPKEMPPLKFARHPKSARLPFEILSARKDQAAAAAHS